MVDAKIFQHGWRAFQGGQRSPWQWHSPSPWCAQPSDTHRISEAWQTGQFGELYPRVLCRPVFHVTEKIQSALAAWLGMEELTRREASELNVILTTAGHLVVAVPFFCVTTFLYRDERNRNREETGSFFTESRNTRCRRRRAKRLRPATRKQTGAHGDYHRNRIAIHGPYSEPALGAPAFCSLRSCNIAHWGQPEGARI